MPPVPPGNTAQDPICLARTGQAGAPCSCPGITGPLPRTVSLAAVAALADHLDLSPRPHVTS
jgi:hypothetical protein